MYNYGNVNGYGDLVGSSTSTMSTASTVWIIVSVILAVIGGIAVYFLFVNKDKKESNKFLAWTKEFFQFKKMFIEDILKITYIIFALALTLGSFALIGSSFLGFILTLILGNLVLRISYEFSLLLIMIWKNTSDISKKLK